MAPSFKHAKNSLKVDGADATLVLPSDWNAEHTVTFSATDMLLGRSTIGAGAAEEIACTAFARSILDDANEATFKATVNLEIGTDVQAYDADLTTWAGITPGANVGTFLATPSSANLANAVTGETGSGALMFGTSPSITTDIRPVSHDSSSLGTAALGFSDLFLGTGAVITFGAASTPDLTVTHGADTLTIAGGSLVLPVTGLTVGSSIPFSDNAGTLTLQNVDALDATTTTTIQTALSGIPTGAVMAFSTSTAPSGWLLCYGQEVSRSTYAALFAVISTIYGIGDNSTTFNLPDLRGRVIAGEDDMGGASANRLTGTSGSLNGDTLGASGGSETHTLSTAQLSVHAHSITTRNGANDYLYVGGAAIGSTGTDSTANAGSGEAHNNVQPTFILTYIIKT